MLKSIAIAVAALTVTATGASAFEICSPTVNTSIKADANGEPTASVGVKFVVGKANCDKIRADAAEAQAASIKKQNEAREKSIDSLLKNIKAYDALNELCEETGNVNICAKAEALSFEINQ